jgi:hypothetical protein
LPPLLLAALDHDGYRATEVATCPAIPRIFRIAGENGE